MRNLIIDQGNTKLKIAIFDQEQQPCFFGSYTSLNAALNAIATETIDNVFILNVGKEIMKEALLQKLPNVSIKQYHYILNLPIKNRYKTPNTLGADRIANACAASFLYPNCSRLIIDIGTCIKYDIVNNVDEYLGGSISPGFGMRLKSMHQHTAHLPLLNAAATSITTGTTTEESMMTGVMLGATMEIKGFVEMYSNIYPDLVVILTGGGAKFIEETKQYCHFFQPQLTLIGANRILLHNN